MNRLPLWRILFPHMLWMVGLFVSCFGTWVTVQIAGGHLLLASCALVGVQLLGLFFMVALPERIERRYERMMANMSDRPEQKTVAVVAPNDPMERRRRFVVIQGGREAASDEERARSSSAL